MAQCQTAGTFQVPVNTHSIAYDGSMETTILASNAVAFQAQLTVKTGN